MNIRSLVYLAQLEEYNPKRIRTWLKINHGRELNEKKGHLRFTAKATLIFLLTAMFKPLLKDSAILCSVTVVKPFDLASKFILVLFAKIKLLVFHRKLRVVAITGSWGKTTTKEGLHELFKTKYRTDKTTGNQNTPIGVARKIIKLSPGTEIFVCEMGAYKKGEIRDICKLVRPEVAIITAIGPMHLERFGSLDNIKSAKYEIVESVKKDGLGIVPKGIYQRIPEKVKEFSKPQEIYYLVAQYFGFARVTVNKLLGNIPQIEHRKMIADNGIVRIIDDSYNSNPVGFRMAVNELSKTKSEVRIIVTPGMIEMGALQEQENYLAAKDAASKITHAIIIGETNRKALGKGFKTSKKVSIKYVESSEAVNSILEEIVIPQKTSVLFENDLPDNYF